MPLEEYREKRRFDRTPEPAGAFGVPRSTAPVPERGAGAPGSASEAGPPSAPAPGPLRFVVHKHDASRLHYDLRLEAEGVLKSWAVPKGPSLDPSEKRLAVQVEDHPLDYAAFEGVIPEGEYGAGTVMVWDAGTYEPRGDLETMLARGDLKVTLAGEKLRGGFALVRMKPRPGETRDAWLLIKERDEHARSSAEYDVLAQRPESVLTGRSMREIAEGAPTRREGWAAGRAVTNDEPNARSSAAGGRAGSGHGDGARASRGEGGPESRAGVVSVAGVALSHPDKVLFGGIGVTKRDLARYYERIAPWILPHLAGRPLVLVRCPEGSEGECFYQKDASEGFPAAIERVAVQHDDGIVHYAVIDSVEGLISLVQLGVLEIHTWGAQADDVERPDRIVLDLDPGPGVPWTAVVSAAFAVKRELESVGLVPFAKTTGGKGMHVVAPIVRGPDWRTVRDVARAVAEAVCTSEPGLYTINPLKERREGRIFVDYIRNTRGATAVAAYSTRAKPGAPVSVPLRWDEVASGVRSDAYDIKRVPRRLAALARDPWQGYAVSAGDIRAALARYASR